MIQERDRGIVLAVALYLRSVMHRLYGALESLDLLVSNLSCEKNSSSQHCVESFRGGPRPDLKLYQTIETNIVSL
jgi:hypothetical protein